MFQPHLVPVSKLESLKFARDTDAQISAALLLVGQPLKLVGSRVKCSRHRAFNVIPRDSQTLYYFP